MVTLWYTYINGTLLSNRKEWMTDTCHNEDYADWIKPIPDYTLYDSIYKKFLSDKIIEMDNKLVVV